MKSFSNDLPNFTAEEKKQTLEMSQQAADASRNTLAVSEEILQQISPLQKMFTSIYYLLWGNLLVSIFGLTLHMMAYFHLNIGT